MDNRLIGKWYTDRTENTLMIGLGYQDLGLEGKEADLFTFGDPIDIFDPQYGNYTPVTEDQLIEREIDKQQTGLYLQDQLRIDDRWVLLGSVRYDQAETDNVNRTTGTTQRADDDQVSWSGGVMYLGDHGINPYLSYTESFEPQASVDDDGRLYEPSKASSGKPASRSRRRDGMAMSPRRSSISSSAIAWSRPGADARNRWASRHHRASSWKRRLPDGPIAAHRRLYLYRCRARGWRAQELIPRHQPRPGWTTLPGRRPAGLKLGGGVRYIGESTYNDITVSDVTLVDAMASYDFAENWRAQLNVNNLTDKEYVASCDYWCYYGESRSVIGSLSYQW